jgi:hypothetical protein
MPQLVFNGKTYNFNNWAELARQLPKLPNNNVWRPIDAKKLFEQQDQFREITTNDGVYYIDPKLEFKPQISQIGLKYNLSLLKAVATGQQDRKKDFQFKTEELGRGVKVNKIRNIISIESLGRENRKQINATEQAENNGFADVLVGLISIVFSFVVSQDNRTVQKSFPINDDDGYNYTDNTLYRRCVREMDVYVNSIAGAQMRSLDRIKFYPVIQGRRSEGGVDIRYRNNNYFVRDDKPLKIKSLFDVEVFEYPNPENKNCVINYLQNHFKYKMTEEINKLAQKEQISLQDLYNFIENNNITAYIYDINGEQLFKAIGKEKNKIFAIIHNNHIYPFKKCKGGQNTRLIKSILKVDEKNNEIVLYEDEIKYQESLINIVESGEMPNIITEGAYVRDEKIHLYNRDYKLMNKIYKHLGFIATPIYISSYNFIDDIIKRIATPIKSYFPFEFKEKGLGFSNYEEDIEKMNLDNIYAVDKNKAYATALYSLKNLPFINTRIHKHYKYNGEEINDDYLYIVKSNNINFFFPDEYAFVWGWYINEVEEIKKKYDEKYINYTITEYIESENVSNYYSHLIDYLYTNKEITDDAENMSKIKLALNIHIGKMQKIIGQDEIVSKNYDYTVATKEHLENIKDKYYTSIINDKYFLAFKNKEETKTETFNNLPLSYAIIQKCRLTFIKQLYHMKVETKDIIFVNVDCIALNNKEKKYKIEPTNHYLGWKEEKITLDKFRDFQPQPNITPLSFDSPSVFKKIQYCSNAFAGGGKTYSIINDLLPKLDNYIVVSSMHLPLSEYRKKDIKTNVIALYIHTQTIPEEEHIIVDEFGLMNSKEWKFIMELINIHNKKVYLYGDNQQLPPVNDKPILSSFLKTHSLVYTEDWTNHRNKFTKEDYEMMIKRNGDTKYAVELINKYCSPSLIDITKDEIIDTDIQYIAYKNSTKKIMNDLIMETLNYKFDKDEMSVGVKIMNTTNNLSIGNTTIYNKHKFTIIQSNDNNIVIEDETGLKLTTTKNIILNNFEIAFCLSLYCIQGQTINKLKFVEIDIGFLKVVSNSLYTLISRITNKGGC